MPGLNETAAPLVERIAHDAERLRVAVSQAECGAQLIDCGVQAFGGLEAGKNFIDKLQMCVRAVSLGTCDTLVSHPASMTRWCAWGR